MIGRTQLLAAWIRLRSTYWFVPALMTSTAAGLAMLLVAVDRRGASDAFWVEWAYGGGADGARALLSAVAGSTITVVSLTFSVTIVALTVSSQHFGPRLLSNFMRDTAAQVVLGMFIGTFAFCLVVLRTVQGEGEAYQPFVPHLSVTVAVALALSSVAALIYYLHHIAASMQVSAITVNVTRDLEQAIDRLFPEEASNEIEPQPTTAPEPPAQPLAIEAHAPGYVQAVDLDEVLALAERHQTTVWLHARPGDFVFKGTELAVAAPAPSGENFVEALRRAYVLGADRTPWQDAEFAIQQLVEVALHALSPGINEPFTAITCIDRLGQGLNRLVTRQVPSGVRTDSSRQVRLIAEPQSFPHLVAAAFDPIALYAAANPAIYRRLLETLAELGARARRAPDRAAIREQALSIRDMGLEKVAGDRHHRMLQVLHTQVLASMER